MRLVQRYHLFVVKAILTFLILNVNPVWAIDWSAAGYTVEKTEKTEEQVSVQLKDADSLEISLRHDGNFSDKELKSMQSFLAEMKKMKSLEIGRIEISFFSDQLQYLLIPKSLKIDGKDIQPFLPSGISFNQLDKLEYGFRLKVKNFFVKIRGSYIDEQELVKKLKEASENPFNYIRKRDPEYFLSKLDFLQERINLLEKRNNDLNNTLMRMRTGFMALDNEGFFSGFKPIDQAKIDAVLTIKKENPDIKREAIKERLEKMKLEVSSKELYIILAVYFNDFPKKD